MEVLRDLRCLQLDPIGVVARSPLLVLWSRLGPYDRTDLDRLLWDERRLFEYWAHAASIVLTEDYQIHDLMMRRYPLPRAASPWHGNAHRRRTAAWFRENAALRRYVLSELRRRGPAQTRDLEDRSVRSWASTGWTNERNVERMLNILWLQGRVAVAGRTPGGKLWDLAERWLPKWTPRDRLAETEVVRRAAEHSIRALGVARPRDIERHFTSGRYPGLPRALMRLERHGRIEQMRVLEDGVEWPGPWYVHVEDLPLLERLDDGDWEPRTTLLSPFDNLIIDRPRTGLLFGFEYRMEIYVPKERRRFGYYSMPILHGDRFIGRLDPALDRRRGRLLVHSVHAEPGVPTTASVGRAVRSALEDLATFVGAGEIEVVGPAPERWARALR